MAPIPFILSTLRKPGTSTLEPALASVMHFESASPATTRYNNWGVGIEHEVDGVPVMDIFYSSPTNHLGRSDSRRMRINLATKEQMEDVQLWTHPTNSRRDFGGGILPNGRIVVTWSEHQYTMSGGTEVLTGTYPAQEPIYTMVGMGWYTSDDGFATFTTHTGYPTDGELAYANLGNIVRHPVTGRIFHAAYGTSPTKRVMMSYSDNNADSFTLLSVAGHSDEVNESGTRMLIAGAGNANVVLGVFARTSAAPGTLKFFRSNAGATSWPFVEDCAWSGAKGVAPHVDYDEDGNTLVLYGDRTAYNYVIRCAVLDTNILATGGAGCTTAALLRHKVIGPGFINSRPFQSSNMSGQFGYVTLVKPDPANKKTHLVVGHDMSPKAVEPYGTSSIDPVQCDTVVYAYENEFRLLARSNGVSSGQQIFPAGVRTQVQLHDAYVDSHGMLSNNAIEIPFNGTFPTVINFSIESGKGGTLEVFKYPAATPDDDLTRTLIHSKVVPNIGIGAVSDVYTDFNITGLEGEKIRVYFTGSGTGNHVANIATSPVGGVRFGVNMSDVPSGTADLTDAADLISLPNGDVTVVAQLTFPKTGWYEILSDLTFSGGASRRICSIKNYEIGYPNDEARGNIIFQREVTGNYEGRWQYFGIKGEIIKLRAQPVGATLTVTNGGLSIREI